MENSHYLLLKVKPTKKEGKIVANVTVLSGILSLECTLEKNEDKYYLNAPSKFIESLKSDTHSGFIPQGKINMEFAEIVKNEAIKQYEEKQHQTTQPTETSEA